MHFCYVCASIWEEPAASIFSVVAHKKACRKYKYTGLKKPGSAPAQVAHSTPHLLPLIWESRFVENNQGTALIGKMFISRDC